MELPIESLSLLGQHVRAYRKGNRYSLQQLAEKAGMSKAHLWEIESAERPNPRLKTMMALAKATETSLSRIATITAMSHLESEDDISAMRRAKAIAAVLR